jgi:phosphoserine phosphatase RsbU/P
VTFANSGLPFPVRYSGGKAAQLPMPGVPLGSFAGSTYDELTVDLETGDVFVFCSDGIFEAFNEEGQEFSAGRIIDAVERTHEASAKEIVGAIFGAMQAFRGDAEQTDDQTVVAVKITA